MNQTATANAPATGQDYKALYALGRIVDQYFEDNGLADTIDTLDALLRDMLPGSARVNAEDQLPGTEWTERTIADFHYRIDAVKVLLARMYEQRARHLYAESQRLAVAELTAGI